MKFLLLTGVLSVSAPIVNYIHEVAPQLSIKETTRLSKIIESAAQKNGLDPLLLAAIIKHESNFKSGIVACWPKKNKCRTCDYGIAQINDVWINDLKLNPCLLRLDDKYNINIAARILKSLKKQWIDSEPDDWFTRYNTNLPTLREVYLTKLEPWLAKARNNNLDSIEDCHAFDL